MTTDRELLEWAAKAHGGLEYVAECDAWIHVEPDGQRSAWWDALHDDADALRLATACGLSIEPYPYYDMPKHSVIVKQRRRGDQMRETNPTEVVEVYGDDPYAATRRAIVRAAASIGQQKEGG